MTEKDKKKSGGNCKTIVLIESSYSSSEGDRGGGAKWKVIDKTFEGNLNVNRTRTQTEGVVWRCRQEFYFAQVCPGFFPGDGSFKLI